MSKLQPNFTAIPNFILDEIGPTLTASEYIIIIFLCRKTYGWQKREDNISISQFEAGTPLMSSTINTTLNSLEKKRFIIRLRKNGLPSRFCLNLTPPISGEVEKQTPPVFGRPPPISGEEPRQNLVTQKKQINYTKESTNKTDYKYLTPETAKQLTDYYSSGDIPKNGFTKIAGKIIKQAG